MFFFFDGDKISSTLTAGSVGGTDRGSINNDGFESRRSSLSVEEAVEVECTKKHEQSYHKCRKDKY